MAAKDFRNTFLRVLDELQEEGFLIPSLAPGDDRRLKISANLLAHWAVHDKFLKDSKTYQGMVLLQALRNILEGQMLPCENLTNWLADKMELPADRRDELLAARKEMEPFSTLNREGYAEAVHIVTKGKLRQSHENALKKTLFLGAGMQVFIQQCGLSTPATVDDILNHSHTLVAAQNTGDTNQTSLAATAEKAQKLRTSPKGKNQ